MTSTAKITFDDVHAARERIARFIRRTPFTFSYLLSRQIGCDIWLKQENRQHTGSFKPRGALNKILSLSDEERARGIVAASAGNHALGVAYACRALGVAQADLFVQATASPSKIAKLAEYPARVHLIGSTYEEAQQAALAHVRETGATYVSAYDDPAIVAGQGTCGLEIIEEAGDLDAVIVPVGGGALIAGIAIAVKSANPRVKVIGVNPAASPSALLSFQRGYALDPYDHEPTLAHGLAGGFGKTAFAVARNLIDAIVLVSEDEMKQAIVALIDSEQILAEASGAAGVAALYRKIELAGKVVVVISGGNIDAGTLRQILMDYPHAAGSRSDV
jgi:threonine dehydratase